MKTTRIPFWASVRRDIASGFALVRKGGARLLGIVFAMQLVVLLVAFPILRWLFREALRASGMTALDLGGLTSTAGLPLTVGLIILLCTLAFWLMALQFTIVVVILSRLTGPGTLSVREVLGEVGRVSRKLIRPSSFPLLCYLFLLLPLTGFGFTSAFIQGIAIPPFITGELFKSIPSAAILVIFLLVLGILNTRFALTVPLFVLTDATGGQSSRLSWKLLHGLQELVLVVSVAAVLLGASLATGALALVTLIPTAISDALSPEASPVVAAYSLGAAQVVALLLTGLVTTLVSAVLVVFLRRRAYLLPAEHLRQELLAAAVPDAGSSPARKTSNRAPLFITTAALALALVLGTGAIVSMEKIADHPKTLVLAHRGFSDGGVENTISGLEAASRAGADLVEMDVMQSKDQQFVVMHDANLKRLTGKDLAVKDLTLKELTAMTVRDLEDNEDRIPTLAEYITRAQELNMQLLLEIKFSGAEPEDHVQQLVNELEDLGALQQNIYHSLDKPSVHRLKTLRPDLTVGYTMAFAAVDVPDTIADFIVVEEWTATPDIQEAAANAGLGFMVWTVNKASKQTGFLRGGVDGIITDHPDTALKSRSTMENETGMVNILQDAITRFVVVF